MDLAKIRLRLVEVFFILSFLDLTYTYNLYIVYGAAVLLFLMATAKQRHRGAIAFCLLFAFLVLIYASTEGGREIYRAFKTLVVFTPFYLADSLKKEPEKSYNLPLLHGFMVFAAVWVIVDVVLFYTTGFTFGKKIVTGIIFRSGGPFEDSNFFCYATVSYLMTLKYIDGRKTKLFIIAVLVSNSVSATFLMLILLLRYKIRKRKPAREGSKARWFVAAAVMLVMGSYFTFIQNSAQITNWVTTTEMHPAVKLKLTSMMWRFNAQAEAVGAVMERGKAILGVGAGNTMDLTSMHMNLHNTYYQMFVEMGFALSVAVILMLAYYLCRIRDMGFLLLYGGMFILGNMLEVYYMPLLAFIYFLYQYKDKYA